MQAEDGKEATNDIRNINTTELSVQLSLLQMNKGGKFLKTALVGVLQDNLVLSTGLIM